VGIDTLIHYPIPPHRQGAFISARNEILPVSEHIADEEISLPIGPHLTKNDAKEVSSDLLLALKDLNY
jgi:dTDP-4-amino-4,6-dideoxygalactose transaminase